MHTHWISRAEYVYNGRQRAGCTPTGYQEFDVDPLVFKSWKHIRWISKAGRTYTRKKRAGYTSTEYQELSKAETDTDSGPNREYLLPRSFLP